MKNMSIKEATRRGGKLAEKLMDKYHNFGIVLAILNAAERATIFVATNEAGEDLKKAEQMIEKIKAAGKEPEAAR